MAYKVELEVYSGPLDLLLYLIGEEEVDIYDIPIARILDKYIEHIERAGSIDINRAADFLLMASQLMEIKSRMLLPVEERPADEEGEEDPRAQLVQQLLAFRAFKEASARLGDLAELRSRQFARGVRFVLPDEERPPEPEPLRDVTLFDIADGYARLMRQTLGSGPRTIIYDEISIEDRMKAIAGALSVRPELALRALFAGGADRAQVAGTFFALLELVKLMEIRIYQGAEFGEIIIKKCKGEEEDEGPPATHVEPYLPPPVDRSAVPPGAKFRAPARAHFAGIELPDTDADDSDEFIAADASEARLGRRIDQILKLADEISARFEASRKARGRPDGEAAESASGGPQPRDEGQVESAESSEGPAVGEGRAPAGDGPDARPGSPDNKPSRD